MPISDSDPRVFFASERTLLAWLRTGITIIALGFVVSRFGLFVQLLTIQSKQSLDSQHFSLSAAIGNTNRNEKNTFIEKWLILCQSY